jgi:hypothetical protein
MKTEPVLLVSVPSKLSLDWLFVPVKYKPPPEPVVASFELILTVQLATLPADKFQTELSIDKNPPLRALFHSALIFVPSPIAIDPPLVQARMPLPLALLLDEKIISLMLTNLKSPPSKYSAAPVEAVFWSNQTVL